eukprot:CAMPEP_0195101788 /NCGR_PEP_ID=MMETSP0448-20130528/65324_1 /TAXON_ID=66468 /ORGANISM="Heterocapsa triquestra, Strain CCMP 448" /LENGTH=206 /DNA_ID=CAMNT_0040137165 /DNA_START=204 /DNA_END=824 /DNA_ORIENTATION=+
MASGKPHEQLPAKSPFTMGATMSAHHTLKPRRQGFHNLPLMRCTARSRENALGHDHAVTADHRALWRQQALPSAEVAHRTNLAGGRLSFRHVLQESDLSLTDELLDVDLLQMRAVHVNPDPVVDPLIEWLMLIEVVHLGAHEEVKAMNVHGELDAWHVDEVIDGQHATGWVLDALEAQQLLQPLDLRLLDPARSRILEELHCEARL